jgi:hypothetical protein
MKKPEESRKSLWLKLLKSSKMRRNLVQPPWKATKKPESIWQSLKKMMSVT